MLLPGKFWEGIMPYARCASHKRFATSLVYIIRSRGCPALKTRFKSFKGADINDEELSQMHDDLVEWRTYAKSEKVKAVLDDCIRKVLLRKNGKEEIKRFG